MFIQIVKENLFFIEITITFIIFAIHGMNNS